MLGLYANLNRRSRILAAGATGYSVTGTTNETTLVTVPLPANTLLPHGCLVIETTWTMTGSTNNKTPRVKLGGTNFYSRAEASGTAVAQARAVRISARSSTSQISEAAGVVLPYGGLTSACTTGAEDLTTALNILITGQLANSGETLTLERYFIEVLNP